jgi:hypothetical protein
MFIQAKKKCFVVKLEEEDTFVITSSHTNNSPFLALNLIFYDYRED